MNPEATECSGSWRPVPHLETGDGIVCDVCKRQVHVRPAPLDLSSGRWPGEKAPRIAPHSPQAAPSRALVETPWSEG